MKRIFLLFSVCAALLMAVAARATFAATDVTGSWTAEMSSPDGNTVQLSFVFKQDGAKLTGTVQGPQGDAIEISNGKVDGDKLSFDVSFNGMTITHEGTIDGDVIKLNAKSSDGNFPASEMTLKRAKTPDATKQ